MRFGVFVASILLFTIGLALAPAPGAGRLLATAATVGVQGDVTCDGVVDATDAAQILLSAGGLSVDAGCLAAAGNVDCNAATDVQDAIRVLRYFAGLDNPVVSGCAAVGAELVPPLTSIDKIEAALTAGTIDHETALKYEIFSVFADPRLPTELRGQDTGEQDATDLLRDAELQWETLSGDVQSQLLPFLLPPLHPDSWYSQRSHAALSQGEARPAEVTTPALIPWRPVAGYDMSVTSASGKYKVWWDPANPEYESRARKVLAYLDNGDYDSIVSTIGRAPLGDGGYMGDDGAIDITYYEDKPTEGLLGWTLPYLWSDPPQRCKATPTFIAINGFHKGTDAGVDLLEMTISHEMFHAAQLAYDMYAGCQLNTALKWLLEGSAKWFETYRFPNANQDQYAWDDMFRQPEYALNDPVGHREYSRYIFFFYLEHRFGAGVIRRIFEQLSAAGSAHAAVDQVVPGGLNGVLPEFALYMWNRPPNDYFKQWDGITSQITWRGMDTHRIGGLHVPTAYIVLGEQETHHEFTPTNTDLVSLTSDYYWFSTLLAGTVKQPASIEISNPLFGARPDYIHLQLAYRLAGETDWLVEDISDESSVTFCRTDPEQNIEEFVVIVTNSDKTDSHRGPEFTKPLVVADESCGIWKGSATINRTVPVFGGGRSGAFHLDGEASDLVFSPIPAPTGSTAAGSYFELLSGQITLAVSGGYSFGYGTGTCTYSGGGTFALAKGEGLLRVLPADSGVEYAIYGYSSAVYPYTQQCSGGDSLDEENTVGIWICSGGAQMSGSSDVLDGSFSFSAPAGTPPSCHVETLDAQPQDGTDSTRVYSWHLEEERNPAPSR